MSTVENDYQFAPSHEWVKNNNDGTVTIGISNHAQELLGDVVFIVHLQLFHRLVQEVQ